MEALAEHGLPELTARELSVLTRRYGLDREPRDSLTAIGGMLGRSRETVRMDGQRALATITHPVGAAEDPPQQPLTRPAGAVRPHRRWTATTLRVEVPPGVAYQVFCRGAVLPPSVASWPR